MPMERTLDRFYTLLIYIVLSLAVIIAYEPIRLNDFVNYDDYHYITNNPHINKGVTLESVLWAFTTPHFFMWHPLTSLSHILDCQFFGLNPFWHHLTNLLFHIFNTLLLFWILKKMTGEIWPSIFVAAAFALHPLNIESVAWVAERKSVLSSFFWMLTIVAYIRYSEHTGIWRYLLVILFSSLGLMAKPMVVTLPFVLLLLDYWPLDRFRWGHQNRIEDSPQAKPTQVSSKSYSVWILVREKIPLLVLSAVLSVITFIAQQGGKVIKPIPLEVRFTNAVVSYGRYIWKMLWPNKLAVFYPHPRMIETGPLVGWAILLLCISVLALFWWRRRPWLLVGWLWYIGTLIPVIGLVQAGGQAMADRYTYIPLIGLFIIFGWGARELAARWPLTKMAIGTCAVIALVALMLCTRLQIGHWRNSITLYEHAIKATGGSDLVHDNLGMTILRQKGDVEGAITHYKAALLLNPNYWHAHNNLAMAFFKLGKTDQAIKHWTKALQLKPGWPEVHNYLAGAFYMQGKTDEAIMHWTEALRLKPDWTEVSDNLNKLHQWKKRDETIAEYIEKLRRNPDDPNMHQALAAELYRQGKIDDAITHWLEAAKRRPEWAEVQNSLGMAFYRQGKNEKAIKYWTQAVRLKPDWPEALNNLAWALATGEKKELRYPTKAVRLAERACELTNYNQPRMLDTLAAAYAAAGRFIKAVKTAEKGIELAREAKDEKTADDIRSHLQLYKKGKSYQD
jgi:tetratricopeptide (TPR) repeat protein